MSHPVTPPRTPSYHSGYGVGMADRQQGHPFRPQHYQADNEFYAGYGVGYMTVMPMPTTSQEPLSVLASAASTATTATTAPPRKRCAQEQKTREIVITRPQTVKYQGWTIKYPKAITTFSKRAPDAPWSNDEKKFMASTPPVLIDWKALADAPRKKGSNTWCHTIFGSTSSNKNAAMLCILPKAPRQDRNKDYIQTAHTTSAARVYTEAGSLLLQSASSGRFWVSPVIRRDKALLPAYIAAEADRICIHVWFMPSPSPSTAAVPVQSRVDICAAAAAGSSSNLSICWNGLPPVAPA